MAFVRVNAILITKIVAILDAGRNALSFFMLLVVSLGLSVVRESLGRTTLRCQILAAAHFIFGGKLIRTSYSRQVSHLFSLICGRYRGTRAGIDFCTSITAICHSTCFYIEWIPYVDHVCSKWFVTHSSLVQADLILFQALLTN